jgi:hypothetical protein
MTRLPAIRTAKITLNPNSSARVYAGWVDTMNEMVWGDSPLEVTLKLIRHEAGEPPILTAMPQGPEGEQLTFYTRWEIRCRPRGRATIVLVAFDPLVAATHMLDLIINGGDVDDEESADPEARPVGQSG